MKKTKVVHLNLDEQDHGDLKDRAQILSMPIATYAKAVIRKHLGHKDEKEESIYSPDILDNSEPRIRKPRTIKN